MDTIIIGAGLAGAVAARTLAERGRRVLLLEKRAQAGGNCYDEKDRYGILTHKYGPHIFHTDDERVYAFLSRFTDWTPLKHIVTARVGDQYVPVPFSLDSLDMCFPPDDARVMRQKLIDRYGMGGRASVLALMREPDEALARLGQYVYENIFRFYTQKQWGEHAQTIDETALGRVPVCVSRGEGYFRDRYQLMPASGYAAMFDRMLAHPNIQLCLGEDGARRLTLHDRGLRFDGQACDVPVIYTGALDALFQYDLGILPYRTLSFEAEHLPVDRFQPTAVVNYTVSEAYTRIAEYKYLTGCEDAQGTTVCREYPAAFTDPEGQIPYYPIPDEKSRNRYAQYARRADTCKNLILLGRLAEYRYYDMDDITLRAMSVTEAL